jgi:hypothetical protein
LNVGDRRAAEFHHQARHGSLSLGGNARRLARCVGAAYKGARRVGQR